MEAAIEDVFPDDQSELGFLGRNFRKGRYTLLDANGKIISPANWEKVVKPGMNITMIMLLLDKKLRRPHPQPEQEARRGHTTLVHRAQTGRLDKIPDPSPLGSLPPAPTESEALVVPHAQGATNPEPSPIPSVTTAATTTTISSSREDTAGANPPAKTRRFKPARRARPSSWRDAFTRDRLPWT